jgi:hypothetical protein
VHELPFPQFDINGIYYRFLVNMHYAFQDRENLYLIIDIMQGGDLRYHFAKHRKFTEEQTSKQFELIV